MRIIAVVAVLFLALCAPALADVRIQNVFINAKGGQTVEYNVRVTLTSVNGQQGPVGIQLFVRGSDSESWRPLGTMAPIGKVPAGWKVSRDLFVPWATADPVMKLGRFEIKAVATGPGGANVSTVQPYP